MTEYTPPVSFEADIKAVMAVPSARPEFVTSLNAQLAAGARQKSKASRPLWLRPTWVVVGIILLLTISILIIGPERVYAAFSQLFGYIPGVGIVNQSEPIRVLAEPVSITRDGVTVTVSSAILTADKTYINWGISGVSLADYPKEEASSSGCMTSPYLRFSDGTTMNAANVMDKPIPVDVDAAIFVMPCIFNTLPGTTPTDWELPLRFMAAPPDLTVMPVIDLSPTVEVATPAAETATPASQPDVTVSVEKVIETNDGYILMGALRSHLPDGQWLQETGMPLIRDANGAKVPYTIASDAEPPYDANMGAGGFPWAYQIKGAGLAFPLKIQFSGVVISSIAPQATAEVTFDAGANPQPGQVWTLNQEVQLAGHTLRLISVTATGNDGYSFHIDPGPELSGAAVEIKDHPANGGGGGGIPQNGLAYDTSLIYNPRPSGPLTIVFSAPVQIGDTQTWQGQWSPEGLTVNWPTPTPPAHPVCVTTDSLDRLPTLPANIDGQALLTEMNPELDLIWTHLDGSQRQVLVTQNGRGALSPDGTRVMYAGQNGIDILDIAGGKVTTLPGSPETFGYWSPDGSQIAYVTAGNAYGIFVVNSDGSNQKQLSSLGYESIAGWSPDGGTLYYAIPNADDPMNTGGFLLRAVDVASGVTQDMFVLKDSAGKSPMPVISPDGNWVAYRGQGLGRVYMMSMDGSQSRLLLDTADIPVSAIVWGQKDDWLGVSLLTPDNPNGEVILMRWQTCEVYQASQVQGELDGLRMK
ncbi:MAG TPA: hypothetical protein VMC62_08475 [Longilinea sp.]|nr:hypothetical protein [Longilinea sp.]